MTINVGGLTSFLCAFLFGLAWLNSLQHSTPVILLIAIIAIVVLAIRHAGDWIAYALGVVLALILGLLLPQLAWPEQALLVVVFGAVLF